MAREYKDSGIEWIGLIPKEWNLVRAKSLFAQRNSKGNESAVLLSATQKQGMMPQSLLEGVVQVNNNTDLQTFKTVHKNDYVISLRSFQGGFEMSNYEGVCSPAYQVFYNRIPINYSYFWFLFKSYGFVDKINSLTVGIREGKNIQYKDFANMLLAVPPLPEQEKIADYLDKVCGEADEMIALQEKMIEELKAYKQSVITEAVTKGLNPNAPMKDSGIDWIGEIPEGWKVKRLKEIFLLQTGTTPKDYANGLDTDNLINWFTPSDVSEMNCELNGSQRHLSKNVADGEGIKLYPKGSLIFVAIGASAGKIGYINIEGYSNQQITALIPQNNCYSKYFYYYMLADRKRIRDNAFFTTLPIINNGYLSSVKILLPPLSEQQSIASYLDSKCSEIDSLITIKQQKIEELKEYKKSVIYEYVTGKKEVV